MYVPTTGPLICPHCSADKIVGFGAKKGQIFFDLPRHGQPTITSIDRHRYRCKTCGRTFLEHLQGIDERRNVTSRLLSYIEKKSLNHSFLSIAKEVGLTEGTVRNIFHDYLDRLEARFIPDTPKVISFDEITIVKKPRYLVCNFEKKSILAMLENTSKATAKKYLGNLPNKEQVQTVIMGIDTTCRDLVRAYLPDAQIVVNPIKIINTMLRKLEQLRLSTRKNLSAKDLRILAHDRRIILKRHDELNDEDRERLKRWEERFRKFAVAYWRKEELRIILQQPDKTVAMEQYLVWQNDVYADAIREYFPTLDNIMDWQEEVFAWADFDSPSKEAFNEAFESVEEGIEYKMKRGYSFDAIKARILAEQGVRNRRGIPFHLIGWGLDRELA